MSLKSRIFLSIISGLLLYIAWTPTEYLTIFIFIALVPLLFVLDDCKTHKKVFAFYPLIAFILWNFTAIWWIYYASSYGAFATFILNGILISIPWIVSFAVYKKNNVLGYAAIIAFYLSFEYLHFYWDASFPWLTLGNTFSSTIHWVQWYEYTGVAGGSLWVIISNIVIFITLKKIIHKKQYKKNVFISLAVIIIPILLSYIILYKEKAYLKTLAPSKQNIVIVQPNYDAYKEKFVIPDSIQIKHFFNLSESKMDSNTQAIILPETALVQSFLQDRYKYHTPILQLLEWQKKHPHIDIITGATTNLLKQYDKNNTALKEYINTFNEKKYYETYNASLVLYPDSTASFYHKSKLVPGAEKMPFQKYLKFLENFMVELGGTNGVFGTQDTPTLFQLRNKQSFAPLICYESIYGDFITDFITKGADFLIFITNDGWWGNTNGYKQHALYGQLRAIENRRYIYRCANTGISMIINPLGEREDYLDWDKTGALKHNIISIKKITFYTKYKSLIYSFSVFITAFILLYLLYTTIQQIKNKKRKKIL